MAAEVENEELNELVMELIDTTISALEESQGTRDVFQGMLEECSTCFENGQDNEGYEKLRELNTALRDFAGFCRNVQDLADCLLPAEMVRDFSDHCLQFEGLIVSLISELETKNFIEIADILRYDLHDNLTAFYPLFDKMLEEFKQCQAQGE